MRTTAPTWIAHLRDRRDARYASKLQQHRFGPLRARPVRRGLVVASFLLLGGAVALIWNPAIAAAGMLYLAAGLLFAAAIGLLNVTMRAHWPDRALDERLVTVRNAAYRSSYRVVGVITGLGLLAASLAWQSPPLGFTFEPHHLRALLLAFVGLSLMMPTAVLAWRERDI